MWVHTPFRTQVTVLGMTCPLCAMAVTEELGEIPGVSGVDVRLDSGVVTLVADREVGRAELANVIAEAGFELVG